MEKIRTDLAAELYGEAEKAYASENKGKPDGIIGTEKDAGDGITVSEIEIENEIGAAIIGKPVGKYVTVSFPTARDMDFSALEKTANVIADEIKLLLDSLPEKPESLLFCGLGNRLLSADAVGPLAFDRVIATRHIKASNPAVFEGGFAFRRLLRFPRGCRANGYRSLRHNKSGRRRGKAGYDNRCGRTRRKKSRTSRKNGSDKHDRHLPRQRYRRSA